MKLFSWNVNGIRAVLKKDALYPLLTKHDPDILCLQETKASSDQVDIDLPGYELYWNSAERKGYAGTAIFTKNTPLEVFCGIPADLKEKYELNDTYGDTTKEGRVITLEYDEYFVSTVYTPNAKEDLSRLVMRQHWDPAYLEYMQRLQSEKPVIYCGDLNVAHTEEDIARPKENKGKKGFTDKEREGFDNMQVAGFVDTFRLSHKGNGYYTWWSPWGGARERNVGWRIDYVMVSSELVPLVKRSEIHPDVMGSDHCPVSVAINI